MPQIENPIVSPLEHLDLVIESLHKATIVAIDKVIGDLVHPVGQGLEGPIKTFHTCHSHSPSPVTDLLLRFLLDQVLLKDRAQLLAINLVHPRKFRRIDVYWRYETDPFAVLD
jgi:hypothetical protein